MNHWPFILAAYGLTIAATFGVVGWSWTAMRAAERDADDLRRER